MMIHSSNNNNNHNNTINDEHNKDTHWNKITCDNSFFTRFHNRRRIEFVPERSLLAKDDFNHAITSSSSSDSSNIHNNDESNNKNLKDNNVVVVFKGKGNTSTSTSSDKVVVGLFDEKLVMKYIKWNKIARIGPGFYNDGNSCYLNSTLQCLIHTPPLAQILKYETALVMHNIGNQQHVISTTTSTYNQHQHMKPILQHFQSLVNEVWNANSSGKAISPRGE
jgi:ubiquitin C-terminal hydrolase